jgi:hypothetical protein
MGEPRQNRDSPSELCHQVLKRFRVLFSELETIAMPFGIPRLFEESSRFLGEA